MRASQVHFRWQQVWVWVVMRARARERERVRARERERVRVFVPIRSPNLNRLTHVDS